MCLAGLWQKSETLRVQSLSGENRNHSAAVTVQLKSHPLSKRASERVFPQPLALWKKRRKGVLGRVVVDERYRDVSTVIGATMPTMWRTVGYAAALVGLTLMIAAAAQNNTPALAKFKSEMMPKV